MRAWLLLALSLCGPAAHAAAQAFVYLEQAQFALSAEPRPPADGSTWQPVSLPHQWRHTHPAARGDGWYRLTVHLPAAPRRTQAFAVSHLRSEWVTVYANGTRVADSRDLFGARGIGINVVFFITVPASLLREGENLLHVQMRTVAAPVNLQGLGRVAFGDSAAVRNVAVNQLELGFYAERAFVAMALAAGLISLFLWFANRADTIILWFSIAFLSWSLASMLRYPLRFADVPMFVHSALGLYTNFGLVVPAIVLALRTAGRKWIRFELALWLALGVALVSTAWSTATNTAVYFWWHAANSALLAMAVVLVLVASKGPVRWPELLELAALGLMALLMFHEVARFLGWVDVEALLLRPYHVPVMLLAFGAVVFERHVDAVRDARRSNEELQRRVAEKARELEAYHAEREAVRRQQTLVEERQRILADMHDGLGASLIGLLRYAERGDIEPQVLQARVREALQELRIAIDALQPAEGDLGSVLGNLRYRVEPIIASAGVRLAWRVPELPRLDELDPAAVLAIQRIVLEAVSNALQHSGGQHLSIRADAAAHGVIVEVADDGRGCEPLAERSSGRGMTNMRARADALGGSVEVVPAEGGGTRVRLTLPYRLAREAGARAA